YVYTLYFKHRDIKWKVQRSYREIKEMHRILSKLVKLDLGRSCSDIREEEYQKNWPLFPTEHDHLVPQNKIKERCAKIAEYLRRLLTYPPFRDYPLVVSFYIKSSLHHHH